MPFLERMPLLYLDKVSIGLFLSEKGGEGSGEGKKTQKTAAWRGWEDTRKAEGLEKFGISTGKTKNP